MAPTKRKDNTHGAADAFGSDTWDFDDPRWDTDTSELAACTNTQAELAALIHEAELDATPTPSRPRTSGPRANRYAGKCVRCGGWVPAGDGYLTKDGSGKWAAEHGECPEIAPQTAPAPASAKTSVDAPEGFHELDGVVFKVQIAHHGSGRAYAKRLVLPTDGAAKGSWEYAPGAVRTLSADTKLTQERAQELGKLYGVCVRCAAILTDEQSIERGIGPICATKGF